MSLYNASKIRPRRNWVIVLADQRKSRLASGIYVSPNESGAEKVTEACGTVVRVGPGEKNEACGLQNGDRIVYRSYFKYANTIETGERWDDGTEKSYFFMATDDVMGVVSPGVEVGVLSGRPAVPERA